MDIIFSLLGVAIFNIILLLSENDKSIQKKRKKKFLKFFNSEKTNALEAVSFIKENAALYKSNSSTKESIKESLGEHVSFTKLCTRISQIIASFMVAFFVLSFCTVSLNSDPSTILFYAFSFILYIFIFLISMFFYKNSLKLYKNSELIMSNLDLTIDSQNKLLLKVNSDEGERTLSLSKEISLIDMLCMLSPIIEITDKKENAL